MQNLAQLAPLIIFIPFVGFTVNLFWGSRMGERNSGIVGTVASGLTFIIAVCLFIYLSENNYQPAIVEPPILGASWINIDSVGFNVSWHTRVDTLSVTMMLFVTFVGTLIHVYSNGYMHGDPGYSRFFAYLNLFLGFMLILVSANNLLMMFVGWEGVGLCSYLLIGFWWDKKGKEGWKNSNAARKAFIVNRIGDFGLLIAIFLVFWTFGTLDFYKAGEVGNVHLAEELVAEEAEEAALQAEQEAALDTEGEEAAAESEGTGEGEAEGEEGAIVSEAEGEAEGEEEGHGESAAPTFTDQLHTYEELTSLGIFAQAEHMVEDGGDVEVGPFTMSIETLLVLVTMFMLIGATGKSAQIPLFVWLPDAMAGPTPVSALIHAATMVTAGVYMMVRCNVFFYNAELTSFIVTLVGASTAIVAGFIAVGQFDIKRVLAYSTISQLGFMVAAVGIGAYPAAMFHMITHAFFKALLFLGSGSVIHGVEHGHHEVAHHGHDDHHDEEPFDPQDMRNMGGLSKKMPITYWTYLMGTLALAGIWPFAGFWSKDEILADAWLVGFEDNELKGYLALGLLIVAAGFTAFYMWRQVEMVFHGKPRSEAAAHAHESTPSMTIPLIILAFFSVVLGFFSLPNGGGIFTLGLDGVLGKHLIADFMEYSILHAHLPDFQVVIALAALALGLGAIFAARSIYGGNRAINEKGRDPLDANPNTGVIWAFANARLYWDEIYFRVFENPFNKAADFIANTLDWRFLHDYFHDVVLVRGFNTIGMLLSRPFDLGIIDGIVNGVGWVVQRLSGGMRRSQSGYVRTYAVALLLGVVAVVILMLLPILQN